MSVSILWTSNCCIRCVRCVDTLHENVRRSKLSVSKLSRRRDINLSHSVQGEVKENSRWKFLVERRVRWKIVIRKGTVSAVWDPVQVYLLDRTSSRGSLKGTGSINAQNWICIAYQLNNDLALQVRIRLKQRPTRTVCTGIAISEPLCLALCFCEMRN